MQIDTHNREYAATDPVGYKPSFLPKSIDGRDGALAQPPALPAARLTAQRRPAATQPLLLHRPAWQTAAGLHVLMGCLLRVVLPRPLLVPPAPLQAPPLARTSTPASPR